MKAVNVLIPRQAFRVDDKAIIAAANKRIRRSDNRKAILAKLKGAEV